MTQCAILVDPFASGKFLPDEFAARGIHCIAVLSNAVPEDFAASFFPEKFSEVIVFDGDVAALSAYLKTLNPVCVMVGLETGVELMDKLAASLGLPGNDPKTSMLRRDKYEMQQALAAQGVPAVKQRRVKDIEEAKNWLMTHQIWPVIVKPTMSAGSDQVFLCDTLEGALDAVAEILGTINLLGQKNQFALLQEYLDGREWVVDTVSCNGEHVVTNVARYLKLVADGSRIVYRHSEFMSPASEGLRELTAYAMKVSDVLGIRYGAAHLEIIVTNNGPVLVEVNARMHGGDATQALRWCHPVTQIDLSVDSHIAPEAFAEKGRQEFKYDKFLIAHFLIANSAGTVTSVADEAVMRAISSYRRGYLPAFGKSVKKTVSLTTSPGYVWLANEDAQALWRDQQTLIAMENDGGLYTLAHQLAAVESDG